jgi:hypothetical protein
MSSQPSNESGAAFLLLVLGLMLVMGAAAALMAAAVPLATHQSLVLAQQQYLQRARERLTNWYKTQAVLLDSTGSGSASPVPASGLLAAAGISERWNAQAFVSSEQCMAVSQGQLCYRNIWVAVPATSGPPPTLSNNRFQPGTAQYIEVSGQPIESLLYRQSLNQLDRIVTRIDAGYSAHEASGGVHNINLDWFTPHSCGGAQNGAGPFNCSGGGFVPISAIFSSTRGSKSFAAGNSARNAWHLTITANNSGAPANDITSPYTMVLKSPLPWGGSLLATAVEPM